MTHLSRFVPARSPRARLRRTGLALALGALAGLGLPLPALAQAA